MARPTVVRPGNARTGAETYCRRQRLDEEVSVFVTVTVDEGIGTIRLDRPPMNALNASIQEELRAAAASIANDDSVAAVVVYGGEKVFAAGADIKEMAAMSYVDMAARAPALSSAFDAVARIPKPVVAAVTGYALGGGCELALACDWRVASADAKLGQPEINLGVIPGAGGTQRLARLPGPRQGPRDVRPDGDRRRGAGDRPGRSRGTDGRRGAAGRRGPGPPVRRWAGAGDPGREAGGGRRPGHGPRLGTGLGEPAVRRA